MEKRGQRNKKDKKGTDHEIFFIFNDLAKIYV